MRLVNKILVTTCIELPSC